MQDLSFISNMSDEDAYLFKRCVRRLLDTTFLVKDKEEKLYQFVGTFTIRFSAFKKMPCEYFRTL